MLALQYSWRMGLAHDEAQAAFEEAHRLAVRAGDVRSQAILLNGFGAALGVGDGDMREFARLQRAAIALAETARGPGALPVDRPGLVRAHVHRARTARRSPCATARSSCRPATRRSAAG